MVKIRPSSFLFIRPSEFGRLDQFVLKVTIRSCVVGGKTDIHQIMKLKLYTEHEFVFVSMLVLFNHQAATVLRPILSLA